MFFIYLKLKLKSQTKCIKSECTWDFQLFYILVMLQDIFTKNTILMLIELTKGTEYLGLKKQPKDMK